MKTNQSKSVRILDMIAATGNEGMRFTDIQRALWRMSHIVPFSREVRGYWCTNLLGSFANHRGLLRYFCEKNEDGRWVRNDIPHNGKPWRAMRLGRATYRRYSLGR